MDGQECDSVLKIYKKAVVAKDTTIASQDRTIKKQDERHTADEKLVKAVEKQRDDYKQEVDDKKKAIKWIKVGWVATTVVSVFVLVLALL